jgi:hypothetical protein
VFVATQVIGVETTSVTDLQKAEEVIRELLVALEEERKENSLLSASILNLEDSFTEAYKRLDLAISLGFNVPVPVQENFLMRLVSFVQEKINNLTKRWLKPLEVIEPGIYWKVTSVFPEVAAEPVLLTIDTEVKDKEQERVLYLDGEPIKDMPALRFYGPIVQPKYRGDRSA